MKRILTKYGTIFMEELNEKREEEDLVKLFDSEGNFLDYLLLSTFDDIPYDVVVEEIKNKNSIEELMDYLVIGYYFVGDLKETYDYLLDEDYLERGKYHSMEEAVKDCFLVNHIGNKYVVVAEC